MQFSFPSKKINERVWFLSDTDTLKFGVIDLITIAISDEGCNVYYGIRCQVGNEFIVFTVPEKDLMIQQQQSLPTPMYSIGDYIEYEFEQDGKFIKEKGTIETISVRVLTDNKVNIIYYLEDENPREFWVNEREIVGFAEKIEQVIEEH